MLDVAQVLWLRRMRQLDDSVRAWATEPPQNEATLLYHLGLIDELPTVLAAVAGDRPTEHAALYEPDEVLEGSFRWDEIGDYLAQHRDDG